MPTHNDISHCARDLWVSYGRPTGRDLEIWLSAECRLSAATDTMHREDRSAASLYQEPLQTPAQFGETIQGEGINEPVKGLK